MPDPMCSDEYSDNGVFLHDAAGEIAGPRCSQSHPPSA
jgi:hypothetical protein